MIARLRRPHDGAFVPLFLAVAVAGFVGLYLWLDLNKLHALCYGYDNGVFLQSIAGFAQRGSAFNWAEGTSHLFVHDSWLLFTLAPLVKLYPFQESMIAVQVALVGSSAFLLYAFSRTLGVSRGAALALSCAYLISPSVQGFAYNEFSEDHFAPLLIFALALCVKKRSFVGTLIVAQLLCGVKEDLALFLVWFGIAGAFWYDRRLGFSVAALAALNAVTYHVVLAALGHHASIPPYQFRVIHPPQDIAFLLEILAPFAFAPLLLRWRLLLALPLLAELFCATNDGFPLARSGVHYTEPLVACAALATALVLRRDERFARWALALSFVMALLFNTTILHAGRHLYAANSVYFRARLLAGTDRRAMFTAEQQGEWAVAASDLNARVAPIRTVLRAQKAAWNLRKNRQPPASFATRP